MRLCEWRLANLALKVEPVLKTLFAAQARVAELEAKLEKSKEWADYGWRVAGDLRAAIEKALTENFACLASTEASLKAATAAARQVLEKKT